MRLPADEPDQVQVVVNSLNAACATTSNESCAFAYSEEVTPVVLSVTPAEGAPSTLVTITGRNFGEIAAMNSVSFRGTGGGGVGSCEIRNATSTWITCVVANVTMAGTHLVTVDVSPFGYSTGDVSFTLLPAVYGVFPAAGSREGGTVITITGDGFADFGPFNEIFVGDIPCIPKTLKNLECRKDPVSMGFACTDQYAKGYAKLTDRQFSEWFDYSNSQSIQCMIADVSGKCDYEGKNCDVNRHINGPCGEVDIAGADAGADETACVGTTSDGGGACVYTAEAAGSAPTCEGPATVTDDTCTAAAARRTTCERAVNRACTAVPITGDETADAAACVAVAGGTTDGPNCEYTPASSGVPGACIAAGDDAPVQCTFTAAVAAQPETCGRGASDVVVRVIDPEFASQHGIVADLLWAATRGAGMDRMTGGCESLYNCTILDDLYQFNGTFGDTFQFTGEVLRGPDMFQFAESATPTAYLIAPPLGMPGTTVEIYGTNLAPPHAVTDTEYYMSRFGFFEQPAEVEVWLGEDAPCALLYADDTYIQCVSTRNTMGETFDVSVWVHAAGLARHSLEFTYDLFVSSMSIVSGSLEGGTTLTLSGSGFAATVHTYGEDIVKGSTGENRGSAGRGVNWRPHPTP